MENAIYEATVAALQADSGGEDVNPGTESSTELADAPPVEAEATADEAEESDGAPVTAEPLISEDTAEATEAETDRGPIPYARFKEVNEAKKQAEQRAQEMEAQLAEAAAARQLLEYLQSDPEATQVLFDRLTGRVSEVEAPPEVKPVTLDDFIAEYDDPAEARAAWAEYKADLANQRLEQFTQAQEAAKTQQAQEQYNEQIKQAVVLAYSQIDKAIESSEGVLDKSDRDLIFMQAHRIYTAGGVRPEDAVGKAVEQMKGRLQAAHSKQMSEYAKRKTQPQPVIQGAGGSAPTDAPPKPGEMTMAQQIAYTEAMLKAQSG